MIVSTVKYECNGKGQMLQFVVHSHAHHETMKHLMLGHAHCLMAARDTQYAGNSHSTVTRPTYDCSIIYDAVLLIKPFSCM